MQWLTDNGSAYTTYERRRFVKTIKEDYIAFMQNRIENNTVKPCSSIQA
nr:Mobile element protein [Klebsiella michiganensis]